LHCCVLHRCACIHPRKPMTHWPGHFPGAAGQPGWSKLPLACRAEAHRAQGSEGEGVVRIHDQPAGQFRAIANSIGQAVQLDPARAIPSQTYALQAAMAQRLVLQQLVAFLLFEHRLGASATSQSANETSIS
jgi:hypothetical protein